MNRWTIIALLLLGGCAPKPTDQEPGGEPYFSLPSEAYFKESRIQSRADLEALPAETVFITSGDHGSVELSSDDLHALARFSRLQRLHLRHCRGIGNAGMDYVATRTSLLDLDLSGCVALTGEGIAKLATLRNLRELQDAIMHGAVKRIRPKFMTVACMFTGLLPIMWSAGTGADVMKRIAAPMIGGIFTSFILELVVYPAIYEVWKWHSEVKKQLSPQS